MAGSDVDARYCIHTLLENGIHEFVLTESSRAAVDEFVEQLDRVFAAASPDETIPCLYDWCQSGIPPLRYGYQRFKAFLQAYPQGPRARSAYLYTSGLLVSAAQSLVTLLSPTTSERFFPGDKRDEAIAWLLERD